jgi:hypothetical protein
MVSPVEKNDAAFVCERSPLLVTAFFLGYLQPIRTSISKMGDDVYYSPKPHPGFQNQRRSCRHPYPQSYSAWLPSTPANRRPWLGGGCSAEPRLDNSCSVRARRCERWEEEDAFPRGLLGTPVQMRWGPQPRHPSFGIRIRTWLERLLSMIVTEGAGGVFFLTKVPISALLADALLAQAIGNFHLLKITRVQSSVGVIR